MKYKVGDKVIVRKDLMVNTNYHGWFFNRTMANLKGKIVTVRAVDDDHYHIKEMNFGWTDEMFEPVITNWDKVKEEIDIKDISKIGNPFCQAVHRVRDEKHCIGMRCDECAKWLKQPYKEPSILDEAEKKYLSNVIRPWRDRVINIEKHWSSEGEFLRIKVNEKTKRHYMLFPCFDEGTMYKGMELDKIYTLDELGL